jgi:hypothetical protein
MGSDAGGLLREWISLFFDSVFNPENNYFVYTHNNNSVLPI